MTIPFENLKTRPFDFQIGEVLSVCGADAKAYLNSQVTSKVEELTLGAFHHSCILDLGGKLVSSFILCLETQEKLHLIVAPSYKEQLLARLEKFHISEDLEFLKTSLQARLCVNYKPTEECFSGEYFGAPNFIQLTESSDFSADSEYFKSLSILTGVPRWGIEVLEGELVNNTMLDELAVSYSKGCYPGQETVAKIDSRRGAAFKPVLLTSKLKLDIKLGPLQIDGKKVGEIRSFIQVNEGTFVFALLNRESRIDQKHLKFINDSNQIELKVNYFPYLKLAPEHIAQEFYDAAVTVFQNGDNSKALSLFQKAIDIHPTFEDAYESIGVLYGREGEFEKAIEMMEQLRELNPKCLMAYTNLSLYHMKIGNIETAEKYKSDATLLNFESLGDAAKVKREQAEVEKRKVLERDKREQMFLQVLEIDDLDSMANNGMGEIYFERAEYTNAKSHFEKAIEGNSKYSVAYLGLAKTLVKQGNITELSPLLELGIKVASTNGDLMPANEMQSMLLKL